MVLPRGTIRRCVNYFLFFAALILSFWAQHTGTKGEYAICWRFAEPIRRFADLHFFVLSASFCSFLLSSVHVLPQTSTT
ncbi:hypothetical protein H5410_035508 [Solanum commersonii]|uniref:Uncharacterized protein n=1 Tax=Solanum commersonii TaxID=4109 RepID=A0A9J5Y4W2_SOLCO|nr:hypothetical protein H5410_035508 [Solanum commersonii]